MSTKGVDLYTFSTEGFMFTGIKKRASSLMKSKYHASYDYKDNAVYQHDHYELDWHRLSIEAKTIGGKVLKERSIEDRGTFSGDIDYEDRNNMYHKSVITPEFCYSFGMYYSNTGLIEGIANFIKDDVLPSSHQIYAVLTENQSRWMEKLFNKYAEHLPQIKLCNLALPGAHDAGMYDSNPQIAIWADTQKDSIADQLQLGARIFDIRPGFSFSGDIRHIHGVRAAAGDEYDSMFRQIASFLANHPKEIVVVHLCDDGVSKDIVPEPAELEGRIRRILEDFPTLRAGNADHLQQSIANILSGEQQPRLIVVSKDWKMFDQQIGVFSSYHHTKANYASSNSANIITALEGTKHNKWTTTIDKGKPGEHERRDDIIEIALQLTATEQSKLHNFMTNLSADISVPDMSPLLSTKGRTDRLSYNWLLQNDFRGKPLDSLVALYNDFFDGGLAHVAAVQSEKRINELLGR